jgi:hypothetical protein
MPRKKPQPKGEVVVREAPTLDEILSGTKAPEPVEDNEPTLEEIGARPVAPVQTVPGFAMADNEAELNQILDQHLPMPPVEEKPEPVCEIPARPVEKPKKAPATKTYQYTSRIQVTDVYRFDGQVHRAPDWVSRDWAAYDDGPTLYIPEIGATARVGDRVVKQDVTVDGEVVSRIAVYTEELFNQLFMSA